jgi:hypothetical protein
MCLHFFVYVSVADMDNSLLVSRAAVANTSMQKEGPLFVGERVTCQRHGTEIKLIFAFQNEISLLLLLDILQSGFV